MSTPSPATGVVIESTPMRRYVKGRPSCTGGFSALALFELPPVELLHQLGDGMIEGSQREELAMPQRLGGSGKQLGPVGELGIPCLPESSVAGQGDGAPGE